jgi:hypothetical protein
LIAKSLTENAESLSEPIAIELKDNEDNNVGTLLSEILPEEVFLVQTGKVKRFFCESSPFTTTALPTDFKEVLIFQSFTGLPPF